MERTENEISFQIPSNMNFETFSAFPLAINESVNGGDINAGDGVVQKISEKISRGLSSSEVNIIRNQVVLNTSSFGAEEWQKQMEYDRIMNEIWIGIVLTLIVISMVFCICSCFLYHQFRHWKQNYRRNIRDSLDIESMKLNPEDDDPVPSYTLVSGLPSYEAAIEQLRKSSNSSFSSYPSVFKIFNTAEKNQEKDCSSEKPPRELVPIIPSYDEIVGEQSCMVGVESKTFSSTKRLVDSK